MNPAHLWAGTKKENSQDMISKGRGRGHFPSGHTMTRGSRSPGAKITEDEVLEIRSRYAQGGITQQELGDLYGVSNSAIALIVKGHRWAHLTPGQNHEDQ